MTEQNDDTRAAQAPDAEMAAVIGPPPRPWWRRPGAWLLLAALLLAAAALAAWLGGRHGDEAPRYVTEPVQRGTLRLSVSATGKLQPTRTVNVGSELSGTVARVAVDVNDVVKKGQVMVALDTAKFRDQVARSRAALASARAGVVQAQATTKEARGTLSRYEEVARLSGGKVPSKTELDAAQARLDRAQADEAAARAAVASAQAALSTDEINLSKASIRSPIDGVVLTRSVDPGNAVAASLQAVTLFTVAEDLARLKLEVNVDEADVGAIRVGQRAEFTVSAWPSRKYPATITRVAYGSTTTDNVVTYITWLDVDNADLSLRPGMTASATITAVEHADALLVPNTALRFTPSVAVAPAASAASASFVSRMIPRPPPAAPRLAGANLATGRHVWVLGAEGPQRLAVQPGVSDGRRTEVQGEGLREGLQVIVDQRAGAPR